mgnify:CR=1 FL=1
MPSSDIFANSTTTTGSDVTLFAGPARIKGFIVTPTGSAGTVTFKDGSSTLFTLATAASAASGPVNIGLPDEGVKFTTNLQATLTNVAGLTAFHA